MASSASSFSRPSFGGLPFDRGGFALAGTGSFGGGGDASWVPDLFGLALGLGTLAAGGFNLLTPTLTVFGARGLGFLGWGLLNAVASDSSWGTNPQSPYYGGCPTYPYPPDNWSCPPAQ